jgi:ribose 5-phosphate isomerase B
MKVILASDHYGHDLSVKILKILNSQGLSVSNVGSENNQDKKSLQEIIPIVAKGILSEKYDFGILICGTGVGVEIGSNKFKGIRASLCRDAKQAENARIYDNANVLCLGSWYQDDFDDIVNAWIENKFDNDPGRIKMLEDFENFN